MPHHILFVGLPDRGHLIPNMSVVAELIRRGHRVTYVNGESMAEVIEASGATLLPYDAKFDKVDVMAGVNANTTAMPLILVEDSGAMIQAALDGLADDVPDIVIGDSIVPLAGRVLGEKWERPVVQSLPVFASNEHFSYVNSMVEDGIISKEPDGSEVFDAMVRLITSFGIETPPGPFLMATDELSIVYLPRAFQFAGDTFEESKFAFVGRPMDAQLSLGAWQPPTVDVPVVLVSLGTVFNQKPDFYQLVTDAFAGQPWHVVVTLGDGIDPDELGALPPNVEVHRWLPHLEVLERASAFVTHGGMGSVMESLYTGTPIVTAPMTPVELPTAKRIAELGIGRTLAFGGDVSAAELRDTVAEVAGSEEILANTRKMQRHVRESGGGQEAADVLEKYLADHR